MITFHSIGDGYGDSSSNFDVYTDKWKLQTSKIDKWFPKNTSDNLASKSDEKNVKINVRSSSWDLEVSVNGIMVSFFYRILKI